MILRIHTPCCNEKKTTRERAAEIYYYDNKVPHYNKIEHVFDSICMCDTVESNHGHHIYILILYNTVRFVQFVPDAIEANVFVSICVYVSILCNLFIEFVFIIFCSFHYTIVVDYISHADLNSSRYLNSVHQYIITEI